MITIDFNVGLPKIRRINIFGKEDQPVTFIYFGLISIGIWNAQAKSALVQAIKELDHDPQWVINNWPMVRQAKKLGYAKGRAQGIAQQMNWKKLALERGSEISKLQVKNNELIQAIHVLRKLDTTP